MMRKWWENTKKDKFFLTILETGTWLVMSSYRINEKGNAKVE